MLEKLAEYAITHKLPVRVGYAERTLKAYIRMTADGAFQDILVRGKGSPPAYAPHIGSAAGSNIHCNFLIEKAKVVLCIIEDLDADKNYITKHRFYLQMLQESSAYEPRFRLIIKALTDDATRAVMVAALAEAKLKPIDPIGFMIDGEPMEQVESFLPWWIEFRKQFGSDTNQPKTRCLVTGELCHPARTGPKVKGLMGGHTAGDAIISANKEAFCSYGFLQGANAPVSEEALTAVGAALTDLIKKAPTFGGSKLVHWYSGSVPDELDLVGALFNEEKQKEPTSYQKRKERKALVRSNELLEALEQGERPAQIPARYYIMPINGAGGRIVIRNWTEGTFEDLYFNILMWYKDLGIVNPDGDELAGDPTLFMVCSRLLRPMNDNKSIYARVNEELGCLSNRMLNDIIQGRPLSDEVAYNALQYIRSKQANTGLKDETIAFQVLKAWIIRRQRQRGEKNLMEEHLRATNPSPAYQCGRMLAVYGQVHLAAMPDVNKTMADRFYTAASNTPSLVMGKLSQMATHHLSKMERRGEYGLAVYFRKMLQAVSERLDPENLPSALTLEEQTQFALGYYHQIAEMHKKKN